MRIIVGGPPGGGFDTYARMIARVMPKHIPGAPTIIVDNMPGAGMMIAANHVYKVAKPDGLTIGHFTGSQTINQVLNQPGVEFDMRKFYYLGAPTADHFSCAFTKASGITSADTWLKLKRPAKMGAVGPGNLTDNTLRVLSTSTNLPIQLISGYKGTAPMRLAMESGELDGSCWGWDSIKSTWARAIDIRRGHRRAASRAESASRFAEGAAGDQFRQESRRQADDRRRDSRRQYLRAHLSASAWRAEGSRPTPQASVCEYHARIRTFSPTRARRDSASRRSPATSWNGASMRSSNCRMILKSK